MVWLRESHLICKLLGVCCTVSMATPVSTKLVQISVFVLWALGISVLLVVFKFLIYPLECDNMLSLNLILLQGSSSSIQVGQATGVCLRWPPTGKPQTGSQPVWQKTFQFILLNLRENRMRQPKQNLQVKLFGIKSHYPPNSNCSQSTAQKLSSPLMERKESYSSALQNQHACNSHRG